MNKIFVFFVSAFLILSSISIVFGNSVGSGVGLTIEPEEFAPLAWMCDSRAVYDDAVQSGRNTTVGQSLNERNNNYAFEGEQISWQVLVMDKNKIEEIEDVVVTIGEIQGEGNDIEVECVNANFAGTINESCNARILEESLNGTDFDPLTQAMYDCTFTVETPDSMYGEFWVTVEAIGIDGSVTIDENEFWFLNPVIALAIDGDLDFTNVRPGAVAYSDTLLIENDADEGSGVLLDMFISGTDFYDLGSSGARCPVTNQLKLSQNLRNDASLGHELLSGVTYNTSCNADTVGLTGVANADHICYFATSGAYSTFNGDGIGDNADAEGYRPIVYGDSFTRDFYNDAEIISNDLFNIGGIKYDAGNVLTPGAEIAMTFKLGLPEPCVGTFDSGDIFFWGEAI